MPSRFEKQKPNPAIKRNVLRARANMQDSKGEKGLVVAGSLAATIAAWVLFALPGSPTSNAVQVPATYQASISVPAQAASSSSSSTLGGLASIVTSTPTPAPVLQPSSASGAAASQSLDSASSQGAATSGNAVQAPMPVTVTRSSR